MHTFSVHPAEKNLGQVFKEWLKMNSALFSLRHKRHEGKKRKSTFWKYDMKRHPASTAVPRRMVAASSIILVQS
ncbi:hypothetical protein TNCT_674741 [Trichonephila clavata]|uniref:Uncharacterized protein n=1 Tax=Trichonephila clavata TaxID=2740835 RepID=A0A8X6HUC6_TRICU|nr:hypothetical protein TNCT_674741 [Trichonephila clavata]